MDAGGGGGGRGGQQRGRREISTKSANRMKGSEMRSIERNTINGIDSSRRMRCRPSSAMALSNTARHFNAPKHLLRLARLWTVHWSADLLDNAGASLQLASSAPLTPPARLAISVPSNSRHPVTS
jgi:hypothetical protein